MKPATRERKERFIASFGEHRVRDAVMALYFRYGLAALTDDQVNEITSDMADDARSACRRNIRNRHVNSAALRKAA